MLQAQPALAPPYPKQMGRPENASSHGHTAVYTGFKLALTLSNER